MYIGIGMAISEIPRLYYLCMLCGYVCCGGKVRDTSADRQNCVKAMNALLVSYILSFILTLIIVGVNGGQFDG
jgi:hypothetical protein